MRRDLPDNLYEREGYYSWRNPDTGREYGIGRDKAQAIAEARDANRFLEDKKTGHLVQRLAGDIRTIKSFAERFKEVLDAKPMADITRYGRKWQTGVIVEQLGDVAIGPRQEDAVEITRRCALFVQGFEKAGKLRTAQAMRTRLIEMFAAMAAEGWIAVNPAEVLEVQAPTVRRARLTLDDFCKIHKAAVDHLHPWAARAIELGLVTIQRREDISRMSFRHQVDGRLLVEQGKSTDAETGDVQMRLRIPIALRLHAVNWSIEDIIKRCRDDVVSSWLVHHGRTMGQASAGDPVHPQTITGAFREARELAGIKVAEGKTPPTFHELRSLGIRLYKKQGYDAQALAGHKDPDTTATYNDNRGREWIDVAA